MFGAFLAAWRRFPEQMQRQMLRDRLDNFLAIPQTDLDRMRDLLPLTAQRPFSELVTALRAWEPSNHV